MKNFKLKLFSLALIIIVLMLIFPVTFIDSSFSHASNGTSTSLVTSGNIELSVYEITPLKPELTIVPGASIPWHVEAKNAGDHPFYLRAKLSITSTPAENISQDCLQPQFDKSLWEYHDGWYYYKTPIDPESTSVELFKSVTVNGEIVDNSYINKQIAATVVAHAVQSDNNPITDNQTFTASGWPKE